MNDDLKTETQFDSIVKEAFATDQRTKTMRSDQLLVRMNHGIRSAVNVILGMTDVIREASELNPSTYNSVNLVRSSAEGLLKDSTEIIDLTRAEQGSLQLCSTSFNLHDTLQQAMDLMSILASCKRVVLRFRISRKVPLFVVGDPARLSQILITLVRAAIDRLDQGEVLVNVERDLGCTDGIQINFSVGDNGKGISHATISRILDGDLAPEILLGGSEASLILARHLARMMGGDLWARAEPRDNTVLNFNVNLRAALRGGADNSEKARAKGKDGRGPLKILVADDSRDTLLLIRAFLKDIPWEIESAEDGRTASEMAMSKPYDLILMDLDMPVMDGYAATRQIRSSECLREIGAVPIVALTAHSEAEAALKSIEAGCTAHVTKPIRRAALIDTIERYADDTRKHLVGR
jgi:CheY-like chemotaxis protein